MLWSAVPTLADDGGASVRAPGENAANAAVPSRSVRVIRPAAGLEALAEDVARDLRRRLGGTVSVGEAAPEILEAVPTDHVGLAATEDGYRIALGLPGGQTVSEEVPDEGGSARETARVLSLVIENLGSEPAQPIAAAPARSGYTYLEYPRTRVERQLASPTLYFGLNIGYSPTRRSAIVAPGAGFGLCVGHNCLVLEAQLSLLADHAESNDGTLSYRFVNIGLRGQFRPYVNGRVSLGPTIGLLVRNGQVGLEGTDVRDIATSLAFRGTVEFAYRIGGAFEWVVEAGVDLSVSRATWLRARETVFLEDRWTPFMVTAIRLRPDLS